MYRYQNYICFCNFIYARIFITKASFTHKTITVEFFVVQIRPSCKQTLQARENNLM